MQPLLDKIGSIPKPKTQSGPSPKIIKAHSQARVSFWRTIIGGVVLGLLTLAYIVALFEGVDSASNVLVILGSGLGFLLGGGDRPSSGEQ